MSLTTNPFLFFPFFFFALFTACDDEVIDCYSTYVLENLSRLSFHSIDQHDQFLNVPSQARGTSRQCEGNNEQRYRRLALAQ